MESRQRCSYNWLTTPARPLSIRPPGPGAPTTGDRAANGRHVADRPNAPRHHQSSSALASPSLPVPADSDVHRRPGSAPCSSKTAVQVQAPSRPMKPFLGVLASTGATPATPHVSLLGSLPPAPSRSPACREDLSLPVEKPASLPAKSSCYICLQLQRMSAELTDSAEESRYRPAASALCSARA
jgi:hypothetical protein